ncbi:hypothetical protein QYF61_007649, partial [Mycteria americana]
MAIPRPKKETEGKDQYLPKKKRTLFEEQGLMHSDGIPHANWGKSVFANRFTNTVGRVLNQSVTRGIPQLVMLGPILLPFFTDSLDDLMECTFRKFADNTKLGVGICQPTLEGMSAIWRNLQRLAKWADRNLIKLHEKQIRNHIWSVASSSGFLSRRKTIDKLKQVQQRATKIVGEYSSKLDFQIWKKNTVREETSLDGDGEDVDSIFLVAEHVFKCSQSSDPKPTVYNGHCSTIFRRLHQATNYVDCNISQCKSWQTKTTKSTLSRLVWTHLTNDKD